jgi:hypothetical protein
LTGAVRPAVADELRQNRERAALLSLARIAAGQLQSAMTPAATGAKLK